MDVDPISNQLFSYNFQKSVLQDPNVRIISQDISPSKPFNVEGPKKADKSKKDLKKQKKSEKHKFFGLL